MRLFHGSRNIIKKPIFGEGKKHNDYGLGFYCTENLDLASEWAVDEGCSGYVNEYELNVDGLSVLDMSSDTYSILNWLAILIDNRIFDLQSDFGEEAKKYLLSNFSVDYKQYDLIHGYRADDSYFSFAQDFLNNLISVRTLGEAMYLGRLGMQYTIKSEEAFERIEFANSYEVISDIWYPRKDKRDRDARKKYYELRKRPWQRGEIYIMNILDEEIKNNDVRIRF